MRASSSIFASTSALKSNITRARRCGLVAAQPGCAALRGGDGAVEHRPRRRGGTCACTSPVLGSNTSLWRDRRTALIRRRCSDR